MLMETSCNTTSSDSIHVLMVEDNDNDHYLFGELLSQGFHEECKLSRVKSLKSCLNFLKKNPPEVILLDLGLDDSNGLITLSRLKKANDTIPVIVLTGVNDDELGKKTIQLGAEDYLPKDKTTGLLLYRAITFSIERNRLHNQLTRKEKLKDEVTNLLNKNGLLKKLEVLIEQADRNQSSIALLEFELEGLEFEAEHKESILGVIASHLKKRLRKSDYLARREIDSFIFVVNNYEETSNLNKVVGTKLSEIKSSLQSYSNCQGIHHSISVNHSFIEWYHGISAEDLINLSHNAMKKNNKSKVYSCLASNH